MESHSQQGAVGVWWTLSVERVCMSRATLVEAGGLRRCARRVHVAPLLERIIMCAMMVVYYSMYSNGRADQHELNVTIKTSPSRRHHSHVTI